MERLVKRAFAISGYLFALRLFCLSIPFFCHRVVYSHVYTCITTFSVHVSRGCISHWCRSGQGVCWTGYTGHSRAGEKAQTQTKKERETERDTDRWLWKVYWTQWSKSSDGVCVHLVPLFYSPPYFLLFVSTHSAFPVFIFFFPLRLLCPTFNMRDEDDEVCYWLIMRRLNVKGEGRRCLLCIACVGPLTKTCSVSKCLVVVSMAGVILHTGNKPGLLVGFQDPYLVCIGCVHCLVCL